MKQNIIGVGITGLVGSRIVELCPEYSFTNASSETGIDITNYNTLIDPIEKNSSGIVIHFAAKTNVDLCEEDKNLGKRGQAWKINVFGTENVIKACRKSNKKIIYISTDYVFDGRKDGKYNEEDLPNPINWYARTKYEGECLVKSSGLPYLICRLAYPYRAKFELKKDFVRTIIDRLKHQERVNLMTDHIFTPTFIDNIAYGLKLLIEKNQTGIFHLVGSESLTPYDAGQQIAKEFNLDKSLIGKTTSQEYLKNKASRPLKLSISNDKITAQGAKFLKFQEGLSVLKKQMEKK